MLRSFIKITLIAIIFIFLVKGNVFGQTEQSQIDYKKVTINTQPLLFLLGYYVLTYDINIADNFILGNAVMYSNTKFSLVSLTEDWEWYQILGAVGLAYFPFNRESIGFHIATAVSPGYISAKYNSKTKGGFAGNFTTYIGYSFVLWDRLKISLNGGGIYSYSPIKIDGEKIPYSGFNPMLMVETGIMF